MALLVPNSGEGLLLQYALNDAASENQSLRLYKNNITPGETDTAGTYTVADFTGYSNISLTGTSWTVTPGAPTEGAYAQQTFTSSADQASQSIYGYYVVGASSGTLLWAERFTNGPYAIANNNDSIAITPKITLD
jgi:hypothetical protein